MFSCKYVNDVHFRSIVVEFIFASISTLASINFAGLSFNNTSHNNRGVL